jgi:hypothetical protein
MRERRSYGRLDDPPIEDGDVGFVGVDERDPSQIKPGFCNEAENYLFRDLTAQPRKGCIPLPWLNGSRAEWPWDFEPDPEHSFEYPRPLVAGVALAGKVFSDANDREWTIVALNPNDGSATQVWRTREGYRARRITMPADFPRLEECSFEQAFDKLLMFCGRKYDTLEMADVQDGFAVPTQSDSETESGYNPGASTNTMMVPRSSGGLFLGNRIFAVHGRDLVFTSDFLNYTRGSVRADFRINQGSADQLLTLYKFSENTVYAFKEGSIALVRNVYGDLSQMRQDELTREFGLVARRAVTSDGVRIWLLSQHGVTSISYMMVDGKVKIDERRVSEYLPKTTARINWQYANQAAAVYHDGKIYFAVPIDDATLTAGGTTYTGVNNAVLVWDTVNDAWAGLHTGGNLMVKEWLVFKWLGKSRLGYVSNDGLIYVYGHTFDDQVRPTAGGPAGGIVPIATRLVSRGYGGRPNQYNTHNAVMKRWRRAAVVLSTWDPSVTLKSVVDGANEEATQVTDQTKSRRRYYQPHNRRYRVENDNDDHAVPYREDYSVDMDRTAAGHPGAENGQILLGSGVNFEQHQEAPFVTSLNVEGRYVQVVVENGSGRAEVKAIGVNGIPGRARLGVAA